MLTATTKTVSPSRSRVARLIPFGAAVLFVFTGALAQTQVPDEMIRKNEITPDDRRFLKALIDANKAGLTGGPAEIKKSRDVLVAPLEKEGVSVPFRTVYASELIGSAELAKLAASDSDIVAANALRIAGQSATGSSLGLVLKSLSDPRPQVRYAATVAARAAFTAAKNNASALTPDDLSTAMRALGDAAVADAASQPVEGALQALVAARDVPGNRSIAIQRLTDAAGKRALKLVKAGEPADLAPFLRLTAPLQTDILDTDKILPEARKSILVFSAQLLMLVDAQWKDGDPDPAAVQTAKAANSLLSFAADPGQRYTGPFADLAAPGKKQQFRDALQKLVGPGGTLLSEPHSIPADKFKP